MTDKPASPETTAPATSNATPPAADTRPLSERLNFGPRFKDVTAEQMGKPFAVVGAESARKK
jgi:hypothetical protein